MKVSDNFLKLNIQVLLMIIKYYKIFIKRLSRILKPLFYLLKRYFVLYILKQISLFNYVIYKNNFSYNKSWQIIKMKILKLEIK